jgi:hypothetical protein
MSEAATETPEPQQPAQAADAPKPAEPKVDETDWKAEARKWEQRAKANNEAAAKLAQIEEANKTEAQKAADRLAAAEKEAAEAKATVLRRDIALEFSLTKDDAALLDKITDEDAMRALAARLKPSDEPAGARAPKPDPNQGRSGSGGPKSTADSFADYFRSQMT